MVALALSVRLDYTTSMAQELSRSQKRRRRRQDLLRWYKTLRGCEDCGTQRTDILTLDHRIRADKNPKLKGGKKRRRNLIDLAEDELLAEIAKCDVVCRKCHDKRERVRDFKIAVQHYERWLAASCHAMMLPPVTEFPGPSDVNSKIGLTTREGWW